MENEKVVVDMTAEDVAEQAARAYTKTVWDESTPITADKLNKIENGIANGIDKTMQIMEIPINHADGWQQFRWTKPNYNTISWTRDANQGKALEILNETARQQLLLLKDDGKLTVNGNLTVGEYIHSPIFEASTDLVVNRHGFRTYYTNNEQGSYIHCDKHNSSINLLSSKMVYTNPHGSIDIGPQNEYHCHFYTDRPTFYFNKDLSVYGNTVWHTGNFNPGTKLDAGYFSISNRDLLIYHKRALVGFDTAEGNYLEINYHRDFAAGVRIQGLTRIESIETDGKLTFSNQIGGGQMSSLINCQALQNNTGNGQMMTVHDNRIYVGNPNTHLIIESGSNPTVNVGGRDYQLYHTGNKPTAGDIGALPLSGGTMNGTLYMESGGKARRRIASVATHGGTDLGDNNSRTTIQSNKVPTWWNGNDNRAMLVFDRPDPSDYIVRCGAGLGGAAGYITFSW